MSNIQPLQNAVAITKPDGTPTDFFIRWAKQRQIDISGGITAAEAQALIDAWALSRDVNAGVGLSGGGNLSTDITVDLENTTVTPGSYSAADITVDAQGRITAAANGAGGTPLEVEDEGVSIEAATTKINFLGAGVTATNPAAGEVDVTIPGGGSALVVEEEGVSVETATTVMDFVGAGVTVTSTAAGEVQVDIPGGGGSNLLVEEWVADGTTSTKTVSAIPAGYSRLCIDCHLISSVAASTISALFRVNGDAGNNYYCQRTSSFNTTGANGAQAAANHMALTISGNTSTYKNSSYQIRIPFYASGVLKSGHANGGYSNGTGASSTIESSIRFSWNNTAAIDSVTFDGAGSNFALGSIIRVWVES